MLFGGSKILLEHRHSVDLPPAPQHKPRFLLSKWLSQQPSPYNLSLSVHLLFLITTVLRQKIMQDLSTEKKL
jgi:hypothetical protein